jgi:hypothetical protein
MATFNFTSAVLDEGTTFNFDLWVCIADGAGDFRRHLVDNTKPKARVATLRNNLDEFVDNLTEMLLPDLAREIEKSLFSTRLQLVPHQDSSDRAITDLTNSVSDSRSDYAIQPLSTRRPVVRVPLCTGRELGSSTSTQGRRSHRVLGGSCLRYLLGF